jgi:hypothetical protein
MSPLVATMKICLLFIASVLLAAYAQQFSELTTYYTNDSQCRQESLVGAIARIVNESACVEQPCNLVPNSNFYRQVSCRQSEQVVPIVGWPTYYVYSNGDCARGTLTEFFFSKPGTCHPITLRGTPVFVTASCYPWGAGATFCGDGCGGVQCLQVNGTQTCSNVDFTFTSGWILGQCTSAPAAPVAAPVVVTPPVSAPVSTNAPGIIPAIQIVESGAAMLFVSLTVGLVLLLGLFL